MLHLLGPIWAKRKAIYGGRASKTEVRLARAQAEEHKEQLHLAAANDAAEACGASKDKPAADQGAKAPEGPRKSRHAARVQNLQPSQTRERRLRNKVTWLLPMMLPSKQAINGPFKPVAIAKAHATKRQPLRQTVGPNQSQPTVDTNNVSKASRRNCRAEEEDWLCLSMVCPTQQGAIIDSASTYTR
ncbi:TPA: hypothetical protein ACH3X1_010546 [Trebouxia sp. C0004]